MAHLGNYTLYNITIVKVKDNLQKIWKISKKPNHGKSLADKDIRHTLAKSSYKPFPWLLRVGF
jgi:hypothetical protein